MSEEEINVAIAECLGWDTDPIESHPWNSRGQWVVKPGDKKRELCSKIMNMPSYCSDLNAMHEARSRIPSTEKDLYMNWLSRIVERKHRMATIDWLVLNASAIQHAEAFLRTLGKWRE